MSFSGVNSEENSIKQGENIFGSFGNIDVNIFFDMQ